MKTVEMERDFNFRAAARVFVHYVGGMVYRRVPEAAVRAITAAKAGKVVDETADD